MPYHLATPPQEGRRDRHPREREWVPRGTAGVNFAASKLGQRQHPVREPAARPARRAPRRRPSSCACAACPKRASSPGAIRSRLTRHRQRSVARRDVQRLRSERLLAAVREGDPPAGGVERAHEEAGLLDLDLPPEAPELHHEHAFRRQEAHRAVEGGAQPRVQDGNAFVRPAPVVMQDEPEGAQRRRAGRGGRLGQSGARQRLGLGRAVGLDAGTPPPGRSGSRARRARSRGRPRRGRSTSRSSARRARAGCADRSRCPPGRSARRAASRPFRDRASPRPPLIDRTRRRPC